MAYDKAERQLEQVSSTCGRRGCKERSRGRTEEMVLCDGLAGTGLLIDRWMPSQNRLYMRNLYLSHAKLCVSELCITCRLWHSGYSEDEMILVLTSLEETASG